MTEPPFSHPDLIAGEIIALAPGEILNLAASSDQQGLRLWRVEAGSVEAFFMPPNGGRRLFLQAFAEGDVLAAPHEASELRIQIVGVGAETRLAWAVANGDDPPPFSARVASLLAPAMSGWLSALSNRAVDRRALAKTLRSDGWVGALGEQITQSLARRAKAEALIQSREAARLRLRDERLEEDRVRVFGRIAGMLEEAAPHKAIRNDGDPLLVACRRAAQAMSCDFALRSSPARRGEPMAQLTEYARAAGLRSRAVALRGDWWRDDLGPLVGFAAADGAAVALLPAGRKGYRAVAADGAERLIKDAATAAGVAPMAAALYAPLPDRPLKLWELLRFGFDHSRGDLATALLMGALGGLFGTGMPLATALIFNEIVPSAQYGRLVEIVCALLATAAGITAFRVAADLTLLRVEGRAAGALQAAVMDRVLRMPSAFFARYASGDLTMRVLMVETIRRTLTNVAVSALLAAVFSLFSLAVLFYYEPRAALAAAALFILLLAVSAWAGAAQLRAILEGETLDANIFGLVQEIINGVAKLRLAAAEGRLYLRWAKLFAETRARMTRSRKIANNLESFRAGYEIVALGLVFWATALLAGGDRLSTGGFLAFVTAFSSFLAAAYQAGAAVVAVFNVAPLAMRARPILENQPEVDDSKSDPGTLSGAVEINAVCFRYQADAAFVLNDLSLSIKAGEYVAIVGGSGSGKSTLARLLLGFERPETGAVFYDRQDLNGLDLTLVRRQIGVVLQASRLMAGSVFENVRGVSEAGEAEVWEALAMAGMADDVRAMPMGLHTVLTEGTAALSGGQTQRLLIARALITRPRVLLFDEATSALDNRTQAVVTESLDRLSVTRIVIAHRLSTVVNADRICVLHGGRVAEQGSYAALMAKNGLFADLARRQTL